MLNDNYQNFYSSIVSKIPKERVFTNALSTLAFGSDASFYRLIPQIVIKAKNEAEVVLITQECSKRNIAVTFRAAGTSLSGQAISDSVLVIAGQYWKEYQIFDNGNAIRLQPGIIGARVNILLSPYGKKIGPDPASINAAMIGGIAANNASGMCCGTAQNSYRTMQSMRVILADGTLLDTSCPISKNNFLTNKGEFVAQLNLLAKAVKSNLTLAEKISEKFKMKNTTGYSLNALVDFEDPIDILAHLMIGSEGTLGFISEITYKTVDNHSFRASSLMIFKDIETACSVAAILKNTPVVAVELMDRAGLKSVEHEPGMPDYLKKLCYTACALLVETSANSKTDLDKQVEIILDAIKNMSSEIPTTFTSIPKEYALLWKIRKGLFPSVGAIRKTGTTVIIEDVTFPINHLARATLDLQALFVKWKYTEAVIFGHALEGNIHFVFTQNFDNQIEVDRYADFMDDVANLVVNKYNGALKAEHGTGRNMAPYVEMEWGSTAYELMKDLKKLFDPNNLLNPGVIINEDKFVHLKNLKPIPTSNEIIDKCIECGFCEPNCVSNDFTLSPRQRIVIQREISALTKSNQNPTRLKELQKNYDYSANQTCATDGLCAISCPVKINTGELVKDIRKSNIGKSTKTAQLLANNIDKITFLGRKTLTLVGFIHSIIGTKTMFAIAKGMHKWSRKTIPLWNPEMPLGAKKIENTTKIISEISKKVVYFPSCINRTMGVGNSNKDSKQVTETMHKLLVKAGFEVIYPKNLNNMCCGMPFSSKGYQQIGSNKASELEKALYDVSQNGQLPIICDMSPCLLTMKENAILGLQLFEPVTFINDILLKYLTIIPTDEAITVFSVCSMKKMDLEDKLIELSQKCSKNVVIPDINCCGFSGDKGFLFPELNKYGLENLKSQIPTEVKRGFSNSRTCEIGLSLHTQVTHQSIVNLVDEVTIAL